MIDAIELSPGVLLVDISDEMPRHATKHYTRRAEPITGWYFHHSGALGKPGRLGAVNSAKYVVAYRKFPGPAYHIWIPYDEDSTDDGDLICYRLNADDVRCWHTGGKANGHGRGIVFQGNTTTHELSDSQIEIAEALIPYMAEIDGLDPADAIRMHCEADRWGGHRKPSCPGANAVKWLEAYRASCTNLQSA